MRARSANVITCSFFGSFTTGGGGGTGALLGGTFVAAGGGVTLARTGGVSGSSASSNRRSSPAREGVRAGLGPSDSSMRFFRTFPMDAPTSPANPACVEVIGGSTWFMLHPTKEKPRRVFVYRAGVLRNQRSAVGLAITSDRPACSSLRRARTGRASSSGWCPTGARLPSTCCPAPGRLR